jgi:hypothetical protein
MHTLKKKTQTARSDESQSVLLKEWIADSNKNTCVRRRGNKIRIHVSVCGLDNFNPAKI